MKKIVFSIITLFIAYVGLQAQIDCSNNLKFLKAAPPFRMNSMSTSKAAMSGENYAYNVPVKPNKLYRFIFYASPVFNNKIHFRIVDQTTKKVVLDLPGENPATNNAKGTAALAPYIDPVTEDEIHPYFDIRPIAPTTLTIYIDVEDESGTSGQGDITGEPKFGCITILILEKDEKYQTFQSANQ